MKKKILKCRMGLLYRILQRKTGQPGNLLHPQSVQLFLFFDFPAQLAVDGRTLSILFLEPIFKHSGKLREQPQGRHTYRRTAQPTVRIASQQPGGIHIALIGGCRQQFDPSLYISFDLFSEQQHLPKLILCVLIFCAADSLSQ